MSPEEIILAAWFELLEGAEGMLADWIDEEEEYGEYDGHIRSVQYRLLHALRGYEPEQIFGLTDA